MESISRGRIRPGRGALDPSEPPTTLERWGTNLAIVLGTALFAVAVYGWIAAGRDPKLTADMAPVVAVTFSGGVGVIGLGVAAARGRNRRWPVGAIVLLFGVVTAVVFGLW